MFSSSSPRPTAMCPSLLAILSALVLLAAPVQAGIWTTKHNLSSSGPGTIKSTTETRVCVFCHIPHNAQPATPLWGHTPSPAAYTVYASSTIQGSIGQPNGSSKLCLACHDGAMAVGSVVPSYSYPIGSPIIFVAGTAAGGVLPAGSKVLGTDLRNDHPVSLTPASGAGADQEIVTTLPAASPVQYDAAGRVQCTSCHNPHDNANGKFLIQPSLVGGFGSQLCLPCHAKGNWTASSHRNSAKVYGAMTVKEHGCAICHKPHAAPIAARLVTGTEEGLCNTCHNGSASVTPAIKNIAGELLLPYKHPTDTVAAKHDPVETDADLNDALKRHAECADCHNPHGASPGTHTPGSSKIGPVLVGAWGLKPVYSATPMSEPVSWQKVVFTNTTDPDMLEAYLCFKCHKPLAKFFNPNNPSYHATVGSPKAGVRGLYVPPWNSATLMTCTDCHSSSSGIKGPHGSAYAANDGVNTVILAADWLRGAPGFVDSGRGTGGTRDLAGGNRNSDSDLCFRCHDRRAYGSTTDHTFDLDPTSTGLSDGTYNYHSTHVEGRACTICHVPHGSDQRALLANQGDWFGLNPWLQLSKGTPGNWSCLNCHDMH
ncbi:MAG: cytochrome c3 family protein [Methanocella sp.]